MQLNRVVIIGAGQGGCQMAASLRQRGFAGRIILVGDEPVLPYQRPPLSKAYLQGVIGADSLFLRPQAWYAGQSVEMLHDKAVSIERGNQRVVLSSGAVLDYDHLVLATGASNRRLDVPGADLLGVMGLHTKADADRLAPFMRRVRHAVVVGAGFIGLEFAAVAATLGASVQVLELASRPMARAVSLPMSQLFREVHEGRGVGFHFNQGLARIQGKNGKVTGVQTSDGDLLPADLVVYGIGVLPNVQLALDAGLEVDKGICVNSQFRTRDTRISAIGDVASFPCLRTGVRGRLESVQNAVDQARALAGWLTGSPAPYGALPWFWSDQGDLKLQIAGLSQDHDRTVVLGSPASRQMTVLCFKDKTLIAVETVNRPADHMAARYILCSSQILTLAEAQASGFDLKTWGQGSRTASG